MNDNNTIYGNSPMNPDPQHGQVVTQEGTLQGQMTSQATAEGSSLHWLQEEEVEELRARWNAIQGQFVDEPRSSVEQADALVADAMERIQKGFANKRSLLDQHWMNHDDTSTEDLRTILQDYRSFFNRLLAL